MTAQNVSADQFSKLPCIDFNCFDWVKIWVISNNILGSLASGNSDMESVARLQVVFVNDFLSILECPSSFKYTSPNERRRKF